MGIDAGVAIVTPVGELDMSSVDDLKAIGAMAFDQHPDVVRIDLSGVTFIDSVGVGGLVALRNSALAGGQTLVLENPCQQVRRVLEITGLTAAFEIR